MTDLQEAIRQLKKAPGFTTTAVITLALGIGATTAIFTLVHQVMLKSLPVTKPEELWRVGDKVRCCNWGGYTQDNDGDFALFSWEAYRSFRAHTPEFTDLAALQAGNASLGVRRAGSQAPVDTRNGEYVSGNFFRTLGVQPWIGRLMTDDDDREGAAPVAVMSYHIWTDNYGSDPSVVGAGYQINGHAFTVIGVTPPGFFGAKLGGGMPDMWIPVATESLLAGEDARLKRPNQNWLDILGRVRPGVNPKTLEAKLRVEFLDWLASHESDMEPSEKQTWRQQTLHLIPGGAGVTAMRDRYEAGLKLLLIAAGCVLLVACGNLANLMLARGLKDRSQTSLRVALGASRGRLVRKALVESTLLAIIGGILGIGVAYAGSKLILYLAFHTSGGPANYVPVDASPSGPVLLFTFVDLDSDRNPVRDCSRLDDFARRSCRSSARKQPFGSWRRLHRAEVAGHRTSRNVARAALGRRTPGAEPAQSRTSEFRIRNRCALSCLHQSQPFQLQARTNGAALPSH